MSSNERTLHEDVAKMAYVLAHRATHRRAWFSVVDLPDYVQSLRAGNPFEIMAEAIANGLRPYKIEGDWAALPEPALLLPRPA